VAEHVWRVVVHQEIDAVDAESLATIGARHISGHSGPQGTSSSILVRATSEEQARNKIVNALGEEVLIREARATPVFVNARIDPSTRSIFESAAGLDQRIGGVTEDEETGELSVYFELPGGDIDRAFNEARGLYRHVLKSAGLEHPGSIEMSMSGFEILLAQASRDRELLRRAHELFDRGENDLAVIVAQTACEVLIADALRSFVQAHASDELGPWLLGSIRSSTLIDHSTQQLWSSVTGSKIQSQTFLVQIQGPRTSTSCDRSQRRTCRSSWCKRIT
jgi:hypothetical protein